MTTKLQMLTMVLAGGLLASAACAPAPTSDTDTTEPRAPLTEVLSAPTPIPATAYANAHPTDAAPTPTAIVVSQTAASVTALLSRYLAETFGDPAARAAWYDHVQSISVRFNTAVIRTDLSSGTADREKADKICLAVSLFPASEQGAQVGDLAVQVYGQHDRLLASGRSGNGQQARASQQYLTSTVVDPTHSTP